MLQKVKSENQDSNGSWPGNSYRYYEVRPHESIEDQFKEVPHLDDLRLVISPDGRITDGKLATGTWNIAKDRLVIRFSGEDDLALKVSVTDNRLMLPEQDFQEADGSGGILYYAFAK